MVQDVDIGNAMRMLIHAVLQAEPFDVVHHIESAGVVGCPPGADEMQTDPVGESRTGLGEVCNSLQQSFQNDMRVRQHRAGIQDVESPVRGIEQEWPALRVADLRKILLTGSVRHRCGDYAASQRGVARQHVVKIQRGPPGDQACVAHRPRLEPFAELAGQPRLAEQPSSPGPTVHPGVVVIDAVRNARGPAYKAPQQGGEVRRNRDVHESNAARAGERAEGAVVPPQGPHAQVADNAKRLHRKRPGTDYFQIVRHEIGQVPVEPFLIVLPVRGDDNGLPSELGQEPGPEPRPVHVGQIAGRKMRGDEGDPFH